MMKLTYVIGMLASSAACSDQYPDTSANSASLHQLVRRAGGVNVIEQGLYNISNSTVSLTADIKEFSLSGLFTLQNANAMAVQTIMTAISEIKKIDPITVQDALVLTPIIMKLATTTNESVQATINQKKTFGGVSPVVKANLQQQLNASNLLTTTIGTKLPKSLLAISIQQSEPIVKSLNLGISTFSTPNVNTPQNSPELFAPRGNSATGLITPSFVVMLLALTVAAVSVL